MGLISFIIILLLWQWAAQGDTSVILPRAIEVGVALQTLLWEGRVISAVGATVFHALTGFGVAVIAGGLLGSLTGTQRRIKQALNPIATALLGTPPIAWLVKRDGVVWLRGYQLQQPCLPKAVGGINLQFIWDCYSIIGEQSPIF